MAASGTSEMESSKDSKLKNLIDERRGLTMGNWNNILNEVHNTKSQYDSVRLKYIADLASLTNRNVIGLDPILHTTGGNPTATESIVNYLRAKFDNDIRVIVPQLAMSAGTIIAYVGQEIIIGRQFRLGSIRSTVLRNSCLQRKIRIQRSKKDLAENPQIGFLQKHWIKNQNDGR